MSVGVVALIPPLEGVAVGGVGLTGAGVVVDAGGGGGLLLGLGVMDLRAVDSGVLGGTGVPSSRCVSWGVGVVGDVAVSGLDSACSSVSGATGSTGFTSCGPSFEVGVVDKTFCSSSL